MNHPFGWDYPAGAEHNPRAPWNQKDHHSECPCHEDQPVVYPVCGTDGICSCRDNWNWLDHVVAWLYGEDHDCKVQEPDCLCAEIAEDAEADRADHEEERARERRYNP